MRTFESNKWHYVKEAGDMPTAEEFGDNRVMVQIWGTPEQSAVYYAKDAEKKHVYTALAKSFVLYDIPAEEPDVCPVCGAKPSCDGENAVPRWSIGS